MKSTSGDSESDFCNEWANNDFDDVPEFQAKKCRARTIEDSGSDSESDEEINA